MEVCWACDWSLLRGDRQAKQRLDVDDLSDTCGPDQESLQERIICIERVYLKNRTFFVLTDCSLHSNFGQGSTQETAKYKPHYTPGRRSFIDTWGIKKWQRCRDGGCNGTKMCHEWMWWYQTIRCFPTRWQSESESFFLKTFAEHNAVHLQEFKMLLRPETIYCFYTAILEFL